MNVKFSTVSVGMLEVNCYVFWHPETRDAYIVDPGDDADRIERVIREQELTPRSVLLTHAHVDHIGAVPAVTSQFSIPVYVHPQDRVLYSSRSNAFPPWLPVTVGLPDPVEELPAELSELNIELIPTPGHTPGSVCYYFCDAALVLSGDTLFRRSVGRTDLPGGDTRLLNESIRNKIYSLPDATRVFPGHGEPTTVGEERTKNPFVKP